MRRLRNIKNFITALSSPFFNVFLGNNSDINENCGFCLKQEKDPDSKKIRKAEENGDDEVDDEEEEVDGEEEEEEEEVPGDEGKFL